MRKLARIAALLGAVFVLVLGLIIAALGIAFSSQFPGNDRLLPVVVIVSFTSVTVGFGLVLACQAWKAIKGHPSGRFLPPKPWPLALVWLVSVALGQSVLSSGAPARYALPILHVMAGALPPLIVLALVGQSLSGQSRWRDMVLQLSSGALVSTSLAIILELALILGLALLVVGLVALAPAGLLPLKALGDPLQNSDMLRDPAWLAPLARSPLVVAGTLIVLAGIVPIIEEAVKAIGVGLLAFRRPTRAEAFLWGVAGGAGFGLVEGLFNSLGGMDLWAGTVALRAGATCLHSLTGGLMGLAWRSVLSERRLLRGLGLYAASVGIHGLWNSLSALQALVTIASSDLEPGSVGRALSGYWSIGSLVSIVGLGLAAIAGLVMLAHRLGTATTTAVGSAGQSAPE